MGLPRYPAHVRPVSIREVNYLWNYSANFLQISKELLQYTQMIFEKKNLTRDPVRVKFSKAYYSYKFMEPNFCCRLLVVVSTKCSFWNFEIWSLTESYLKIIFTIVLNGKYKNPNFLENDSS